MLRHQQTMQLILPICEFELKHFYNIGPRLSIANFLLIHQVKTTVGSSTHQIAESSRVTELLDQEFARVNKTLFNGFISLSEKLSVSALRDQFL
jgi:hypothetical protein